VIDTHCHLLAGVDDGPRSDAESVRLARHLADQGVKAVVCTPHFSELFPTPCVVALERHQRLRAELNALGVQLETSVAAEVSPPYALEAPLERLATRTIGSRYLLVELVRDTTAVTALQVFERLVGGGLVPIFAHPERCAAMQRDLALLDDARAAGALTQIVAPSLGGRWGDDVWATAWALVESGRADLLASDSHSASSSAPQLGAVAGLVEQRCGRGLRERLTESTPARVLGGVEVEPF
jgi:protein-tyrosine phosphatase